MSLTPAQEASYAAIIDEILAHSDLSKISAKAVRGQLSAKIGQDVSAQKEAVNTLIGQRFDKLSNQQVNGHAETSIEPPPTANGVVKSIEAPNTPVSDPPDSTEPRKTASKGTDSSPNKRSAPSDESELSEPEETPKPKKKRTKAPIEEDDAAYAARLQAELNSEARPTRGGGTRKRMPIKKEKAVKKKKKSATKIKADDDSDLSSPNDSEPKEKKGGFHKPMALSPALSELLGETQLSRPQTVKKIWEYVREHNLQNPKDKRQILCDDAMRAVFKSDKVHMFTMNKTLSQNLHALDEI